MKKIKETENGLYEWIEVSSGGGFWSKIEDPKDTDGRIPFSCPLCGDLTYNIDNKCLLTYFVCQDCYIMHIEGREIDNSIFSKGKTVTLNYLREKITERNSLKK